MINGIPFNDIVWTEKGNPINISEKDREEFSFTGLNNIDFLYYLTKCKNLKRILNKSNLEE